MSPLLRGINLSRLMTQSSHHKLPAFENLTYTGPAECISS
jgi:hypothetical protein